MKRWEIFLYGIIIIIFILRFFPNEFLIEWLTRRITFSILAFFSYQQYKKSRVSKWQTRILYLVQLFLIYFSYPTSSISYLVHIIFFILVLGLLASTLAFPIPVLPIPIGPNSVGTTKYVLHQGDQHVPVKIWYPTEKKYCFSTNRDQYFEDGWTQYVAKWFSVPHLLINYFPHVKTHSYCETPLSSISERYPVILFSHGMYGIPELYTLYCENLASLGYVVFGIYHTDGSALNVEYPNGKYIRFQSVPKGTEISDFRKKQLEMRVIDIQLCIKKIQDKSYRPMVDPAKAFHHQFFDGRLDESSIRIFGHSFGGMTAVAACCMLKSIHSCVCLDGWFETFDVEDFEYKKPMLFINAQNWQGKKDKIKLGYMLQQLGPKLGSSYILRDSFHQNFSDLTFIIPNAKRLTNMLGKIDGWTGVFTVVNSIYDFLNFRDVHMTTALVKEDFQYPIQ